jgi:hypothetical protein
VTVRFTRADVRFAAAAALLIVAGGLVAAVNSAAPFEHGSWLAAYLVLVGGVSQAALAVGALGLRVARPQRLRRAQLVLWNAGVLIVPAGVLVNTPAVVWLGSAILLAALACFALNERARPCRADRAGILYGLLIAVLGVSVLVGCVLARGT